LSTEQSLKYFGLRHIDRWPTSSLLSRTTSQ